MLHGGDLRGLRTSERLRKRAPLFSSTGTQEGDGKSGDMGGMSAKVFLLRSLFHWRIAIEIAFFFSHLYIWALHQLLLQLLRDVRNFSMFVQFVHTMVLCLLLLLGMFSEIHVKFILLRTNHCCKWQKSRH